MGIMLTILDKINVQRCSKVSFFLISAQEWVHNVSILDMDDQDIRYIFKKKVRSKKTKIERTYERISKIDDIAHIQFPWGFTSDNPNLNLQKLQKAFKLDYLPPEEEGKTS